MQAEALRGHHCLEVSTLLQPPLHHRALLLGLCPSDSPSTCRAPHAQAHLLSRCWCLYEMWSTLMGKGPQALQILLPGGEFKGPLVPHKSRRYVIAVCVLNIVLHFLLLLDIFKTLSLLTC